MMGQIIVFPQKFNEAGAPWEPFVTEQCVARHFAVTTRTIRRWRELGMPSMPIGGTRRYRLSECQQWHERRAS